MRVLVDGRALGDASATRGIGTYLRGVLPGLAAGADVEVLAPSGTPVPAGRAVRTVRLAPGRWADREHDLLLPLDLRRRRADVVLSPALDPPRSSPAPWVQTLHDVAPLLGAGEGAARWRRQAGRYRRADAVVAVSAWAAATATERLGLDPARVHVVPHGVDPRFSPGPGPGGAPYLLLVAEHDPRKRHDLAFAAVGALAARGTALPLVVTGRIAPWHEPALRALVAAAPRPDLVELRGHVPADELVTLYRGASAVLVTSTYEGFGLPALEAMACGAPVVAYDGSATAEVVGDGGVLVPQGDERAYVDALEAVVADPGDLPRRAVARAAASTWDASARGHLAVLRSVAS